MGKTLICPPKYWARNPQAIVTINMSDASWNDYTVIDQEDLLEYVFKVDEWENNKLRVSSYCIRPGVDTLNIRGFVEFLKDNYPKYVFSKKERQEYEWPFHEAIRRSDFTDDSRYDAKLGELVLFVLVDAILDLPMVSHKISLTQEPVQPVKGSDGLFFGEFQGEESIAFGESKIYTNRNSGLGDALESTSRFEESYATTKTNHELRVARKGLSEDLSAEDAIRVADAMYENPGSYRRVFPIFLGYEEEWMEEIQYSATSSEELEQEIKHRITEAGIEDDVLSKIRSDYEELQKSWLVFFMFPLEDVDKFRQNLQEAIFPHSTKD
ncbi:DUF1837 domain-containing protein [Halorubellus litoreus]|uniref:DUF1837 domain-containing protein n=1 Tax=Halorubellus litoreus TaxID=755308 RepID=A0ABD5VNI3_9EURY